MKIYSAELKRYNANTRNASVGDCVKRALSFAFKLDYDAVAAELNRIKRSIGYSTYAVGPVYNQFLEARGVNFQRYSETGVTLSEFADSHPSGVWLVLTGDAKAAAQGRSNHMVCVVDGDVYDSWDSLNSIVVQVAQVHTVDTTLSTDSLDTCIDDVVSGILNYVVNVLDPKCKPYLELYTYEGRAFDRVDKYTYELTVCATVLTTTAEYGAPVYYRAGDELCHTVVLKYNPRLSLEDNVELLVKKGKQKVYDWIYVIRKDLADAAAAVALHTHPRYTGSKSKLVQLPEWSRPLVSSFYDDGDPDYGYKFEVEMDALPNDPRASSLSYVTFRADTLRDLKTLMEHYRRTFRRQEYDY